MNNEKLNSHSPSHYNTTTHVCYNVIQSFAISNNYVTPVAIVCILVHEKSPFSQALSSNSIMCAFRVVVALHALLHSVFMEHLVHQFADVPLVPYAAAVYTISAVYFHGLSFLV